MNKLPNVKLLKKVREPIMYIVGMMLFVLSPFYIFRVLFYSIKVLICKKNHYFSFSEYDVGFRVWYAKIALDFKRFGRFGHSWDDGLGLSLGARAYNNWVTYTLVRCLGQMKMAVLGYFLWLVSIYIIGLEFFDEYLFILVFILSSSPLIVQVYFNLGKPEIFWWFLVPFISYYSFSGAGYIPFFLWSLLAIVNASSAFLVAFSIVLPLFIVKALATQDSIDLLFMSLLALPGFGKLCIRLYDMYSSGFLAIISNEQVGLWKRDWLDISDEFVTYVVIFMSLYFSLYKEYGVIVFSVYFLFLVMPYYLNFRMIYFNDIQSFFLMFLSHLLPIAVYQESYEAIVLSFFVTLRMIFIPKEIYKLLTSLLALDGVVFSIVNMVKKFPFSKPIMKSTLMEDALADFFSCMENNSRLIILSECRLRNSKYRNVIEKLRFILVEKGITQINDMYGAMQSKKLSSLNFDTVSTYNSMDFVESMDQLLIDYIIIFDSDIASFLLETKEFELVKRLNDCEVIYLIKRKNRHFSIRVNYPTSKELSFFSNVSGNVVVPFYYAKGIFITDDDNNVIASEKCNNIKLIDDVHFFCIKVEKGSCYKIKVHISRFNRLLSHLFNGI